MILLRLFSLFFTLQNVLDINNEDDKNNPGRFLINLPLLLKKIRFLRIVTQRLKQNQDEEKFIDCLEWFMHIPVIQFYSSSKDLVKIVSNKYPSFKCVSASFEAPFVIKSGNKISKKGDYGPWVSYPSLLYDNNHIQEKSLNSIKEWQCFGFQISNVIDGQKLLPNLAEILFTNLYTLNLNLCQICSIEPLARLRAPFLTELYLKAFTEDRNQISCLRSLVKLQSDKIRLLNLDGNSVAQAEHLHEWRFPDLNLLSITLVPNAFIQSLKFAVRLEIHRNIKINHWNPHRLEKEQVIKDKLKQRKNKIIFS